ncbi:MAG: hypothetical protein CMJ18_02665 [Phycisphaeraceae bacterium]|nr:hypothetical protein [Phycisphaeraceae bacterium]
MAAHKGSGLTVLINLLAGALSGGGCTRPGVTVMTNTMASIAIDPAPFTDRKAYFDEIHRFAEWVAGSPPVDPERPVLLPGQVEHETRQTRLRDGIPIDDETWRQIREAGVGVGMAAEAFNP